MDKMPGVVFFVLLTSLVAFVATEQSQQDDENDIAIESSSMSHEQPEVINATDLTNNTKSHARSDVTNATDLTNSTESSMVDVQYDSEMSNESEDIMYDKFGWVISLGTFDRASWYRPMCTGSLIQVDNKPDEIELVLTSANCAKEIQLEMKYKTYYAILLGQEGGRTIPMESPIVDVILHENHTSIAYDDQLRKHDIAIVKVNVLGAYRNTLKRISLPQKGARAPSDSYTFGHLVREEEGSTDFGIYESTNPVQPLPSDQCEEAINKNGYSQYIEDIWLCIENPVAYIGEKGSPYFTSDECGATLYGLKSSLLTYGTKSEGAVLTNIGQYVDWIKSNAGN